MAKSWLWINAQSPWYICILFCGEDMGWQEWYLSATDWVESQSWRTQISGPAGKIKRGASTLFWMVEDTFNSGHVWNDLQISLSVGLGIRGGVGKRGWVPVMEPPWMSRHRLQWLYSLSVTSFFGACVWFWTVGPRNVCHVYRHPYSRRGTNLASMYKVGGHQKMARRMKVAELKQIESVALFCLTDTCS